MELIHFKHTSSFPASGGNTWSNWKILSLLPSTTWIFLIKETRFNKNHIDTEKKRGHKFEVFHRYSFSSGLIRYCCQFGGSKSIFYVTSCHLIIRNSISYLGQRTFRANRNHLLKIYIDILILTGWEMKDSIYHNSQALSAIQYSPVAFYHINSFPWWVLYIRYSLNWHLSQVFILRGNCSLPIQASDVTFNQRTNPDINLNPACCFFFRYVWTLIKNLTIHCYDIPSTHCSSIFFKHHYQWESKSDRYAISP